MKKSALYSTIVMIVVIVCCITAVTYSFFSTQKANYVFELGSKVSESFTWSFNEGEQTAEENVVAGSDTSKLYARRVLAYSSNSTAYGNMYITVSDFQYRVPDAGETKGYKIIDPKSDNAMYMDEITEFQIVVVDNVLTAEKTFDKNGTLDKANGSDVKPVAGKWKRKTALVKDDNYCLNLGEIAAGHEGVIVVFIRLNVENELLPPAMNQVEVVATIESREL